MMYTIQTKNSLFKNPNKNIQPVKEFSQVVSEMIYEMKIEKSIENLKNSQPDNGIKIEKPNIKFNIVSETPKLNIVQETPKLNIVQETPKLNIVSETPKLNIVPETSKLNIVPEIAKIPQAIKLKIEKPKKVELKIVREKSTKFLEIPGMKDIYINEDGTEVTSYRNFTKSYINKDGSLKKGKSIKIYDSGTRKAKISLRDLITEEIESKSVFYLVAKTFLPNPQKFPFVAHVDDENDHHYTNLKWYSGSKEHETLQWKIISEFPEYMISEYGDIVSYKITIPKFLKIKTRYVDDIKFLTLSKNGISSYSLIHYLVAKEFIPNPYGYKYVKHIGEQSNNHYTNLKWCKSPNDLPDMEWKTIPNYTRYSISEFGHVISNVCRTPVLRKSTIKVSSKNLLLYTDDNRTRDYFTVDYLVATAFHLNPNNYEYVVHLDGDYSNDHKDNLRWAETPDLPQDDGVEWRDIPNFPDYKVSDTGLIKSYKKRAPYILKPYISDVGYPVINLYNEKGNHSLYLHRVVATVFLPNPLNLPIVDHVDYNNKLDASVKNLRWSTAKDNSNNRDLSTSAAAKAIAQIDIDWNIIQFFESGAAAQRALNLNVKDSVNRCARGDTEFYAGFRWAYVEDDEDPYEQQEGEIFKPVDGEYGSKYINYPNYAISNFGTLINVKTGLKRALVDNVYGIYNLCCEGECKGFAGHILVASFFVEGRTEERCYVNHRDENKLNCHYTNLEWVTQKENVIYSVNRRKFAKVIEELKNR